MFRHKGHGLCVSMYETITELDREGTGKENRDRLWAGGWLSAFCQVLLQSSEESKVFKLKPGFSGCIERIFAKLKG